MKKIFFLVSFGIFTHNFSQVPQQIDTSTFPNLPLTTHIDGLNQWNAPNAEIPVYEFKNPKIKQFTQSAKQKLTIKYTLNSTLGPTDFSEIKKGGATITYDFNVMKITVQKANNKTDIYKIASRVSQGMASNGEEYSDVFTMKGGENFHFRLLSNRVMIVHISSRTGFVYYK